MIYRLLMLGFAAVGLMACGGEPEGGSAEISTDSRLESVDGVSPSEEEVVVRDVQFFLDNPEERRAVRDECRNNPGALEDTQDCINADEANSEARRQSTRERLSGGE